MSTLSREAVLLLGLGVMARFRCKKVATKPDARSWSIEQDFLAGVETSLRLCGQQFPEIIRVCQRNKRSITTLKPSEIP